MTKQLNFIATANNQNREAELASNPRTSIATNTAHGRNAHFDDEEFQLDV